MAQGEAMVSPADISELLEKAPETYRREVAGSEWAAPTAPGTDADVGELIAKALATSRPKGVVSTPDVAKGAEEAVEGRVELRQPREVDSERTAQQSMARMQEGAVDLEAVAPCGGVRRLRGWRSGCGSGGSGARWRLGSRARRGSCTTWTSPRASAMPGCRRTCGHG